MGGDIVIVTSGEARRPLEDLPACARFMYLVPLSFYVISAFLVGLNINFMDPDLHHLWAKPLLNAPAKSQSPFIIAIRHTTIKVLPKVLNGCFLVSAYTAA
jgi:amino acid transporter